MTGTTATHTEPLRDAPAPPALAPSPAPAAQPVGRRKFTADEFERMGEAGILADQERVELIDGDIVVMSRIGSPHSACVSRLNAECSRRAGDRAIVRVQDPIRLDEGNEPEPDVVLARPREDYYQAGHPRPDDIFLVVEVMDTSAAYDRGVKLPLYARAAIREVWLVDLAGALVEAHRRPLNGQYAEKSTFTPGQRFAPEAFPDLELAADAILSRPTGPS